MPAMPASSRPTGMKSARRPPSPTTPSAPNRASTRVTAASTMRRSTASSSRLLLTATTASRRPWTRSRVASTACKRPCNSDSRSSSGKCGRTGCRSEDSTEAGPFRQPRRCDDPIVWRPGQHDHSRLPASSQSGRQPWRPSDAPAGDAGGDDADELLLGAASPWLHAQMGKRGEFGFRIHEVRRALDVNAPPFLRGRPDLVYLEGNLVLRVRDAGAQILHHRAVQSGSEHDRPFMQLIVDRQYDRPEPAGVPNPANAPPGGQTQALLLVQQLPHLLADHRQAATLVRLLHCHGAASSHDRLVKSAVDPRQGSRKRS